MDGAIAAADSPEAMNQRNTRPRPADRTDFSWFAPITTRWMDNDVYGHLNNVVYYSFFDTAVNQFLIQQGALDFKSGPTIGLVVHSQCHYFKPLAFPGAVDAGLRVSSIGNSSVEYRIGLFAAGVDKSAAWGQFVHVYVDSETRRPRSVPLKLRDALAALDQASTDSHAPR